MALNIIRMSPMCHRHCGRYFPAANDVIAMLNGIYDREENWKSYKITWKKQRGKQKKIDRQKF
jgi:hypothetical protein